MKKFIYCLLLFLIQLQFVFSQDEEWDTPESRGIVNTIVHGLIGSGETILSNWIIRSFNGFLVRAPWAFPTPESVRDNLSLPWEWEDTDDFVVNHIGHPYQGSLYFNSGRVNGFGFYQSVFFNALGSFTWEAFGESNHASINDFIATVAGSMTTGEILYRLYVEAYSAGVPPPLAFLINPMAGFHSLLTGWKPPNTGRNLYRFQMYLGIGYAQTHYSILSNIQKLFYFRGPFADIGFKIAYGNPFEQDTWVPFRHFELALSLGMNPGSYSDFRIASDAYLFSFSPIYSNKDTMSTGLSLHLDFASLGKFSLQDSTINQYSNALDWTIKYRHLFSQYTSLEVKSHAGITFLGASKYYSPITEDNELNNYGFGFNNKNFFILEHKKLGRLELDLLFYALWTYPEAAAFSQGNVFWGFADLTYNYFVSEHFSIGITGSLVREWGTFSGFPDTKKKNDSIKLFIAWNL